MERLEIKQWMNFGPAKAICYQAYRGGEPLSELKHLTREDAMREIFEYQLAHDSRVEKARPIIQGIWDQVKDTGVVAPYLDPPMPDDIEPLSVELIWRHGFKYADMVLEANTGNVISWRVRIDDKVWDHHDYFDFEFPRLLQRMYK